MSVMDIYGATEADEVASSVGAALRDKQVLTLNHPAYQSFSNDVVEELTRISERVAARKSTARRVVVTSALTTDHMAALYELYPEFEPVSIPLNRPVHSFWVASRVLANEWCATITENYASTCVHFGGSLLHTIMRKAVGFHLEADKTDDLMLHECHSAAVDAHRLFQDYASVQAKYGVLLPRTQYDDYLRGRSYSCCSESSTCVVKADSMCIDLSVVAMSPVQTALAMLQHGIELCHGFFIYHPSMLVQDEGQLPMTGVSFSRTDKSILFHYPEGRAGVASYSKSMYACWLTSHCFSVGSGDGNWFQLELMKNRGSFMFFRLAKLDSAPGHTVYKHALDFPADDDYTLVESWRLKKGFRSDPSVAKSWEKHTFMARSRVVRRVREFAMQLAPEQFTRFAVKKQIRVVNNRWVVNGTSVTVSAPLSPQEVEDLTTAIYSRAFVDRYQSSQLASEMMVKLRTIANFHSASFADRLAAVARAVASAALEATVVKVDDWFRGVMDGIVKYFSPAVDLSVIALRPAPTYVLLSTVVGTWKTRFLDNAEALYSEPNHGFVSPTIDYLPGGTLGGFLRRYARRSKSIVGATRDGELQAVVRVVTDVEDVRLQEGQQTNLVSAVSALNEVDNATEARYNLEYQRSARDASEIVQSFKNAADPDPVASLNSLYLELFPEVANQSLEYDTFSLSLDPQDRVLTASMLKMRTYFGLPPNPRSYYRSRLKALNVPKRQNTAQELLTAIAARNLNAPVVSMPQEEDSLILDIWESFLNNCCVENAGEKLLEFQSDPVALAEDALTDWGSKAKPGVLDRVVKELESNSKAMGEMPVNEYLAMLKADVKPTLSTKPVGEVTAPQVIVYHEKAISALYSSLFRVLVRRFLSLLKPNYHVNLLKDSNDISQFMTDNHPFGEKGLSYLENDFGKYDKSQSRFVFNLEEFVFRKLGMNEEMLDRWVLGHVECSIRSVAVGLSLHVMYQRKSGDATTAFGNVILNVLSVNYAYRGTSVVWAVFMGDDSLVCARTVGADADSVTLLAEVFNLSAKYYITESPYFASNFVVVDDNRLKVRLCPDVVKRIERLSMHISAEDPQWVERFISFQDSMKVFQDESVVQRLAVMVPQRYAVSEGLVRGAVGALGTLVRDKQKFRSLWEQEGELLQA